MENSSLLHCLAHGQFLLVELADGLLSQLVQHLTHTTDPAAECVTVPGQQLRVNLLQHCVADPSGKKRREQA